MLLGLTRAFGGRGRAKGVTVNAVCPGFTETDIVQDAIRNIVAKQDALKKARRIGLGQSAKTFDSTAEVAQTVVWLCQPSSASQNGQTIAIAGGEVM